MSFSDAIKTVLSKYATFSGRARRSEFWWFALFALIVVAVVGGIGAAIHFPALVWVVELALLLPSLAVTVRRLHDTGRSGWWLFIDLIPLVGGILLLVWYCQDSQGDNKFGPSPKHPAQQAGFDSPFTAQA